MNLSEIILNNQTLQSMALNTTQQMNCSGFVNQGNIYIFIASIILFVSLLTREQFFKENDNMLLLFLILVSTFFIFMISLRIVLLK